MESSQNKENHVPSKHDWIIHVDLDAEATYHDPFAKNIETRFFYMLIEPPKNPYESETEKPMRYLWSEKLGEKLADHFSKTPRKVHPELWFFIYHSSSLKEAPVDRQDKPLVDRQDKPMKKVYAKAPSFMRDALFDCLKGKSHYLSMTPTQFTIFVLWQDARPPIERFWYRTRYPIPENESIQPFVPCNLITHSSSLDTKERAIVDMIHIVDGYFLCKAGHASSSGGIMHPVVRTLNQIHTDFDSFLLKTEKEEIHSDFDSLSPKTEKEPILDLYEHINVPYCMHCFAIDSDEKPISICKNCHAAGYCSKECQKAHWKEHKTSCIDPKLREERTREINHALYRLSSMPPDKVPPDAYQKVYASVNEKYAYKSKKKEEKKE